MAREVHLREGNKTMISREEDNKDKNVGPTSEGATRTIVFALYTNQLRFCLQCFLQVLRENGEVKGCYPWFEKLCTVTKLVQTNTTE